MTNWNSSTNHRRLPNSPFISSADSLAIVIGRLPHHSHRHRHITACRLSHVQPLLHRQPSSLATHPVNKILPSYPAGLDTCPKTVSTAATKGFTPPKKDTALTPQEQENEKWNAKAKNHIFRGLCKEVFNRVWSHKTAHALWKELCALHEGSKSEREERYHLVMNTFNTFEMLPK